MITPCITPLAPRAEMRHAHVSPGCTGCASTRTHTHAHTHTHTRTAPAHGTLLSALQNTSIPPPTAFDLSRCCLIRRIRGRRALCAGQDTGRHAAEERQGCPAVTAPPQRRWCPRGGLAR
jgi:hypothetical protein